MGKDENKISRRKIRYFAQINRINFIMEVQL